MSCEAAFIRALRERGMRMTPQRELVLSVMHEMSDHATPEEIYRVVHERSAAVDISTVYRTLDGLNMLAVCETADGQRRYALAGAHGNHAHLVCQACGQESQVDTAPVENLAEELARRYGFSLDVGHLTLPGLCAGCAARSE
jgi:Fur family transcriptional regulator, ferric uptake regulator